VDVEPHETALPTTDPFTVNWAHSRQLLKQAILNPKIALVQEIDVAITTFTSTMKSAKTKASELRHTYPPRDSAIPDLEEPLRRKRKARINMHNFNRAADRRKYNFFKKCIHRSLKHRMIKRFVKILKIQITCCKKNGLPSVRYIVTPQVFATEGDPPTHGWTEPQYKRTSYHQTLGSKILSNSIDRYGEIFLLVSSCNQ
jgi:hypothetical protein